MKLDTQVVRKTVLTQFVCDAKLIFLLVLFLDINAFISGTEISDHLFQMDLGLSWSSTTLCPTYLFMLQSYSKAHDLNIN
jgi:hypothetical protein